jgi:6-phosphogluconolactonase (cycloisomerase 2 family)
VAFSANGKFLLATEKTKNDVAVFGVLPNGTLSAIEVNPSAGPGAFAVNVAPNGTAVVSETGSGGTLGAFAINANGALANLGTLGGLPAGSSLNGIAAD